VLALIAPALVGVFWGTYLSPKRRVDLPKPVRFALELVVFGIAALALFATGQDTLALVLAAAAVVSGVLNYVWGDEPRARPAG